MKFRTILKKIIDTKQLMGEVMKVSRCPCCQQRLTVSQEASFSLAEAKFASGDFNQAVLQSVNKVGT